MVTLHIPVERIAERANTFNAKRFFLRCLVAVPLALGWVARAAWTLLSLLVAAIQVGWESGPKGVPNRDRASLR